MTQLVHKLSRNQPTTYRQQDGAVLIVALSLLVILTILGISVMESSVVEEKMAGNNLDRNVAFQAAETALRAAEDWISQQPSRPEPITDVKDINTNTVMELNALNVSSSWWRDSDKGSAWWQKSATQIALDEDLDVNTQLAHLPTYIIEEYDRVCDGAINDPSATTCKIIYRITARGWGGSSTSTVLLQSLYAKRF